MHSPRRSNEQSQGLLADEESLDARYPPNNINFYVHYRRASFCQKLLLLWCAILMVFGFMAIVGMTMCMVKWGGQPRMNLGTCAKWMWLWR